MIPSPLPHNLPAEESAVSILAQVPAALTAFPWDEKLFLAPHTRAIFNAITDLAGNGVTAIPVAILASLEKSGTLQTAGGTDNVRDVLKTYPLAPGADAFHADYFFSDLAEKAALREILQTFARRQSDIVSSQVRSEDFIAELTEATATTQARKPATLKTQLSALIDEIENRTPPESFGFGISSIDRELDGGFQRGELTTVAGPTGGGKSLLLAQAALDATRAGKAVVFFSLEMPAKAVLRRLVANYANSPLPKPHEKLTDEQSESVRPAIFAIERMPLTICDHLHTMAEIESESRRLIKLGKAEVVIVDYVQRIRHAKADTREQAVAEVTSRLKSLALQSGCAVLTASQLNKQGDVRESAAIEFDSDIVLKITDDGILCQKFRRGASNFVVPVTMQGALGRFDGTVAADANKSAILNGNRRPSKQ